MEWSTKIFKTHHHLQSIEINFLLQNVLLEGYSDGNRLNLIFQPLCERDGAVPALCFYSSVNFISYKSPRRL